MHRSEYQKAYKLSKHDFPVDELNHGKNHAKSSKPQQLVLVKLECFLSVFDDSKSKDPSEGPC